MFEDYFRDSRPEDLSRILAAEQTAWYGHGFQAHDFLLRDEQAHDFYLSYSDDMGLSFLGKQAEQRIEFQGEHAQFAEFFRQDLDAADVRVEEIASVFSGASSGAKPTGGHSTTWRKHKEHHEYVVKRSLQRARRRALLGGTTMYRGRLYTSAELGLPGTPYLPSQLTVGSRRALQARDKGRLDHILAAWPPECGPLTEEQARPLRAGQLGVLSVNLGGFSKEGYDEFQQWAHSPNVVEHVHIIFLQETWRPSSEFSSDSWHWIQSGTKKAQHQGVAILLSKKLAAARCVRFAEVVKGRILKVHLPAEPGNHLRRRPITLICVYQRARVSEQAVVYEKRELGAGQPGAGFCASEAHTACGWRLEYPPS